MPVTFDGKLVVAILAGAVDFEEENRVFDREGERPYVMLQMGRWTCRRRHGVAFPR